MELKNPRFRTLSSGMLRVICNINCVFEPMVISVARKLGLSIFMWKGVFSCCDLMTLYIYFLGHFPDMEVKAL